MKITFASKQVHMTDDLRLYAEKKVSKLERFFKGEPDAAITFSRERDRMTVEVTLKYDGHIYRSSQTSKDMYASIDAAVGAIEQQIRKNKTRLAKSLRDGVFEEPEDNQPTEDVFDVVRTKRFPMKPMPLDEAILQMNLLNHEFFAFQNQDDGNAFAVVYKRNNGGYGLIESGK